MFLKNINRHESLNPKLWCKIWEAHGGGDMMMQNADLLSLFPDIIGF